MGDSEIQIRNHLTCNSPISPVTPSPSLTPGINSVARKSHHYPPPTNVSTGNKYFHFLPEHATSLPHPFSVQQASYFLYEWISNSNLTRTVVEPGAQDRYYNIMATRYVWTTRVAGVASLTNLSYNGLRINRHFCSQETFQPVRQPSVGSGGIKRV